MRPQLSLIGFCTLCIAVSEGNPFHSFIETIAPGMPHLLQNTQSVQASNKTDISRATHVLAVLSAPLQVVIVRRLLGSHSKHILVADKDIAKSPESSLSGFSSEGPSHSPWQSPCAQRTDQHWYWHTDLLHFHLWSHWICTSFQEKESCQAGRAIHDSSSW